MTQTSLLQGKNIQWALLRDADGWSVIRLSRGLPAERVAVFENDDAALLAEHVAAAMGSADGSRRGIALVISSAFCLAASFEHPRSRRSAGDRSPLLFMFEEHVPYSVEELAVDFIQGTSDCTLGVSVVASQFGAVIEKLETAGIGVDFLMPLSLLAVQSQAADANSYDVLLWADDCSVEAFEFNGGRLHRWSVLSDAQQAVRSHLRVLAARSSTRPLRVKLVGPFEATENTVGCSVDQLRTELGDDFQVDCGDEQQMSFFQLGLKQTHRVLTDEAVPWIQLRRDSLASRGPNRRIRKSLTAAVVAATLAVLCCSTAMFVRASRYRELGDQWAGTRARVYQDCFPGTPIPVGARSRMESEKRRLLAVTTTTPDADPRCAFRTLHQSLAALPTGQGTAFESIETDSTGTLRIRGTVQSRDQVGAISKNLKAAGFDVQSPTTNAIEDQRFSMSLTAVLASVNHASDSSRDRVVRLSPLHLQASASAFLPGESR